MKLDKTLSALKWIGTLGSAIAGGTIIPAYSWYVDYAPPLFPAIGGITSALGVAIIIYTIYRQEKSNRAHSLVTRGLRAIGCALGCLTLYCVLLSWSTVVSPQDNQTRFQTGFGRASWSLTTAGKELKRKYADESVSDWMLRKALFKEGGPEVVWKEWTVNLAGWVMIVMFFLGYGIWSLGFTLLAKQVAKK